MKGITLPNLGPQTTRDNLLQTAIQAQKDGFDSLWTITIACHKSKVVMTK